MKRIQNYEKQIASRIAYLRYMKKWGEFDFMENGLHRELEYLMNAYGDNATIKDLVEEMLESDDNTVIAMGKGEYQTYRLVPDNHDPEATVEWIVEVYNVDEPDKQLRLLRNRFPTTVEAMQY